MSDRQSQSILFDNPFDPSPSPTALVLPDRGLPGTAEPDAEPSLWPAGERPAGRGGLAHEVLRRFPGAVILSELTDEQREQLQRDSDRRGFLEYFAQSKRIPRSRQDRGELQALCEWLHSRELDTIGAVTFSDAYAAKHNIYSLSRAMDDVAQALRVVPMKLGTITGFRGRYVLCGEWHPSGRLVPHVHLALDSMGVHNHELLCSELWRYFYRTRGRARFEPMRDVTTATLYGLKDTMKATRRDADAIRFRLCRHRGR